MVNPDEYSDDAKQFLDEYKTKTKKSVLDDHADIISSFNQDYERAYQQLSSYYDEAYRDLSMALGNQWSQEEMTYLTNQRRSAFTYNMIRRLVNLVEGIQRDNRLAIKVSPIEDSSDYTAEIMTDVMQYIMQTGSAYDQISQAFRDSLVTGISWLCPYLDYRDDPENGDVKVSVTNWNDSIWDPFFFKKDMSDCSFWARRKYLDKDTVISLLPDKADIIEGLPTGIRDEKFSYMSFARNWGLQKLMNYTEYWRRRWVIKNVLVDTNTGEVTEWKGDKERLAILRQMYPSLEVMRKPVKTVELGVIVEGQLLYYGTDPWGLNDYPCVPIFGGDYAPTYDLYTWKLQGIVRYVRDPQVELNKRISRHVDLLDSQLNSGWIAKTGAVTNTSSLFKSGNGQVVFIKPDSNMEDVQRIQAPDIPQGQMLLTEMFNEIIPNILGINPEMLGMPENEKVETAAILAQMRQAAGLVSLRGVFDNLAESQKILGQKILKLMQKNYSPEKVRAITKKDPTEEFFSKSFSRYDVVVEEGLLTNTQRQTEFMQLTALKQMGMPIPDSLIIQKSNLHCRKELNEILDAQAQQEQKIADEKQQMELQQMQLMSDGVEAKAQSDISLAAERLNKIHLDQALSAERIRRAETDHSSAQLNIIKAIKELEGMDIQSILGKIEMLKAISDMHDVEAANDRQDLQQEMQQQSQVMPQTGQSEQMLQQPNAGML